MIDDDMTAHRIIELELIRHTRTAAAPGLCYGHTDVPLADSFPDEAQLVIDRLAARSQSPTEASETVLLSSPLSRCRRLADCVAASWNGSAPNTAQPIQPELDERLQELDFGEWDGRTWSDIDAADRERSRQWMNSCVNTRWPGGESYAELAERTVQAMGDAFARLAAHPNTTPTQMLVIAHAGPIRALLAHLLDLPLENSFRLQVDYGRSSRIRLRWTDPTAAQMDLPRLAFGCSDIQILSFNQA